MGQGDPPAVRAETSWLPHEIGPASLTADRALVDVPDRQGKSGKMGGRQVAAIGAEAEDEDLAIAPSLEVGDLRVVGDAADLDRPISEPERIAGHCGVEGGAR